jgi:hypothetical protein
MFIEIEGHLINTDHIADITPQDHIALTTGSVICITNKDKADELRLILAHPLYSYAPGDVGGPVEQSAIHGGLFNGMSDSEILESLKSKETEGEPDTQAEAPVPAEPHKLDEDPSSFDIGTPLAEPTATPAASEEPEEYHS